MEKRGLECREYSAIYYLNANGGLTAADLLTEMAMDGKFKKLSNSELFKTEFVEKVLPPEDSEDKNPLKLDEYVLEKVQLALKTCRHKIDTDFYASAADYLNPSAKKPAEET